MIADMSMLHLTQEKRPAVEMVAALMVTRAIGQGWVAQQSKLHGRFTEPGIMCFRQRIRHSFGFLPTPLERHNTTWTPCGLCARLLGRDPDLCLLGLTYWSVPVQEHSRSKPADSISAGHVSSGWEPVFYTVLEP